MQKKPIYIYKYIMFTFNAFILTGTSCKTIYENGTRTNGVYTINPDGQGDFEVYCDLDDARTDGSSEGGWTVIQRRMDAAVGFYRYSYLFIIVIKYKILYSNIFLYVK